jgi:hypothetical protein
LTSVTVMPWHAHAGEGFAHLVELERFDDGGNEFHGDS